MHLASVHHPFHLQLEEY